MVSPGQPAPVDRIGQPLRPLQNPLDLVQSSEVRPEGLPFPPPVCPTRCIQARPSGRDSATRPGDAWGLSGAADAMEALLECSSPGLRLTPAADPIARGGIAQTPPAKNAEGPTPPLTSVGPCPSVSTTNESPRPRPRSPDFFSPPPAPIPPPRRSPAPVARAEAHSPSQSPAGVDIPPPDSPCPRNSRIVRCSVTSSCHRSQSPPPPRLDWGHDQDLPPIPARATGVPVHPGCFPPGEQPGTPVRVPGQRLQTDQPGRNIVPGRRVESDGADIDRSAEVDWGIPRGVSWPVEKGEDSGNKGPLGRFDPIWLRFGSIFVEQEEKIAMEKQIVIGQNGVFCQALTRVLSSRKLSSFRQSLGSLSFPAGIGSSPITSAFSRCRPCQSFCVPGHRLTLGRTTSRQPSGQDHPGLEGQGVWRTARAGQTPWTADSIQ